MTEHEFPYSKQNIEAVIFVGKSKMISLEYIFYDKKTHTKFAKLKSLQNLALNDKVQDTNSVFNPNP